MILDYPPEYFSHLADGALDVFVDKEFTGRQERWIFEALDQTGYEINQVKRRKKADFRVNKVDVVDVDKPNVLGRAYLYPDKDLTTIKMKTFNIGKYDRFIINHEIGHSLGLAHQFETPVGETVMNYPTYNQIVNKEAANRLTDNDLNHIRNFRESIINGDDLITGQHYCTSGCIHQITN